MKKHERSRDKGSYFPKKLKAAAKRRVERRESKHKESIYAQTR